YDIIVINGPLQDETGESLALDAAEKSNALVLLAIPREIYEDVQDHVTDHGVLVIPKPLTRNRVDKAIRYLTAVQNKIHVLERKNVKAEEKLEEMRIINKAKFLLVEQRHMTEDQAHRFVGKQAMDHGISRKRAAQSIIDDME
ncbi:MAG: ANTAR domain-containing response regulator, partial [Lachnospiraceae bacterium]